MKASVRVAAAIGVPLLCVGGWLLSRWAFEAMGCAGDIKHLQPCLAAGVDLRPLLGIGMFWLPIVAFLLAPISMWIVANAVVERFRRGDRPASQLGLGRHGTIADFVKPQEEPPMSSPVAEVTQVVRAFADCWNRHDMDAFAQLFAPDAEFVNVVGLWWKGRDEIRKAHAFTHSNMFRNSRLTVEEVSVRFPGENIAIARARWMLEGHVAPDGAALPSRNGILLNVLARGPHGWTIVDSQNTDIVEGQLSRPQ